MKNIVKELCRGFIVGCVLPALLLILVVSAADAQPGAAETNPTVPTLPQLSATRPPETDPEVTGPLATPAILISVELDRQITQMDLEDYVLRVVLGEVPADFEPEALKAQAVVARTFALKLCESKRHDGAVCTRSSCCQAYRTEEMYLQKGGTEEKLAKVCAAVEATRGQVLTYGGKLINATYFSCSGGSTEDAVAVWGYDVPYLQSVQSPGEEDAAAFYREKTFTPEEFCKALAVRLEGKPQNWFGRVTYTDGGGVETMTIGGVRYKGTTLRSLLDLRSTMFTVAVEKGNIVVRMKGYGHRVGMSQYGADAMALAGSSYADILAHYYVGSILTQFPLTDG
jgi:stage II sporulation protein D